MRTIDEEPAATRTENLPVGWDIHHPPPRYLALNGLFYSIAKWLHPTRVTEVYRHVWTRGKAAALAREIGSDGRPTVLLGFSSGATAALEVAGRAPNVTEVYAHSPVWRWHTPSRRGPWIHIYGTVGDRLTGPTRRLGSYTCYHAYLAAAPERTLLFQYLPPQPFPEPTRFERLRLAPNNHQFHNCLHLLPKEVLRQ